jgi:peptidyl-prolyl cis-trans isomerase D
MLDIMRRQKRLKLILWFVILGLALGMLLFFVPGGNMGRDETDSTAATIDGNSISMREYRDAYSRIYERLFNSGEKPANAEKLKAELPQGVLMDLVSGKIKESLGKKFGIEVTPAEVRQAIESYPLFQSQHQFAGVGYYLAMLQQNKITPEDFERDTYQRLLLSKLRAIITDSYDTITDDDLRAEFSRTYRKTQVDYVLLKNDEYKKRVKSTEAELQSYFEAHKGQYPIMEKRRAQFLVIPGGQFINGIPVSDKEIDVEWSMRPHNEIIQCAHILFKVSAEAQEDEIKANAEKILKLAKADQDFGALAKKYSEDKQSAGMGGFLAPFSRGGAMGKEFEDAAFSLEPGKISGLVRTEEGYHIIKVLKREKPSLDSKRAELTKIIQSHKAMDRAKQEAEKAVPLLEKQKDLNQVVSDLGVKGVNAVIKTTPPIMKTDRESDFGISQAMRDEMFELKESNPIGKVVKSLEGYAIPKLIEVQSPKLGDFAASRSKVEQDYAETKTKELLLADAQKLSTEATRLGSLEKAAKEMRLSVKKSQPFTQSGTPDPEIGENTPFNRLAFELKPGDVSSPQMIYEKNMAVFQVKSRTPFDESAYQKEKGALRNKQLQSMREPYFQEFMQKKAVEMEKEGKIYINPKAAELVSRNYY